MVGDLVGLSLGPGEGHAVVGGDHHQGVLELAALLQHGQHLLQVPVEVLDLESVVEHVGAHRLGVRPVRRHGVDVRRLPAWLAHPCAVLVGAVGFEAPVPEREGLTLGARIQEGCEVGRVVVVRDVLGGGRRLVLLVGRPRQLTRLSVDLPGPARSPALAGVAHVVAVVGQSLRPGPVLLREIRPVIRRRPELPGVPTGEDDRPGRGALGVRGVGASEQHPLPRHPIEARCAHPGRPVRTHVGVGDVVGHREEDVGRRLRLRLLGLAAGQHA